MTSDSEPISSLAIVRQLWSQALLPTSVLENTLSRGNLILHSDPGKVGQAIRSSFQLTAVAQGCCAAIALADRLRCALVRLETLGERSIEGLVLERVEVDARHAIAEYVGWTRLSQTSPTEGMEKMLQESIPPDSDRGRQVLNIDEHAVADWDALAGLYRTEPDPKRDVPAVVRIHTNFPHHKLGILQLLDLAPKGAKWNDGRVHEEVFSKVTKEDIQRELMKWNAFEFERAAREQGLCVTAYRSRREWEESEMGQAVKDWMEENGGSAFRISRIPPNSTAKQGHGRKQGARLKVIDMSRVIAGPISTRTLAAHGANVILLSNPELPNLPLRELDTARGKRTAFIDLPHGQEPPASIKTLLAEADVFSQAYRPQGLAERGLGAETMQAIRPGIVYAELCAFGFTGPWCGRRAYDSLTQTACGMNFLESVCYLQYRGEKTGEEKVEPKALPVQALDYAAGSLMCFATLACKCRALIERLDSQQVEVEEGWKVQVSLASTAEWIVNLGQLQGDKAWVEPPQEVIPVNDLTRMAAMVSSYKVRGLTTSAGDADARILAVRHASVPAATSQQEDIRWTVPSHLGLDVLNWS